MGNIRRERPNEDPSWTWIQFLISSIKTRHWHTSKNKQWSRRSWRNKQCTICRNKTTSGKFPWREQWWKIYYFKSGKHIHKIFGESNGIWSLSHLVRQRSPNYLIKLVSLAKLLSVPLRTKWLLVRIPLLSHELQI